MIVETTAATPPQRPALAGTGASDLNTFLRLLTTQIRNQDPTKPLDSADFAVQLATFSGVEQQVRTNQLLEALTGAASGLSQVAGWVGKEARVNAPAAFSGMPLPLWLDSAAGADGAVLVTSDESGSEVRREAVPIGTGIFEWDGLDQSGTPLPPGTYRFALESYAGEERIASSPVEIYARIDEVRAGAEGPVLVLEGGSEVPAASVTALR